MFCGKFGSCMLERSHVCLHPVLLSSTSDLFNVLNKRIKLFQLFLHWLLSVIMYSRDEAMFVCTRSWCQVLVTPLMPWTNVFNFCMSAIIYARWSHVLSLPRSWCLVSVTSLMPRTDALNFCNCFYQTYFQLFRKKNLHLNVHYSLGLFNYIILSLLVNMQNFIPSRVCIGVIRCDKKHLEKRMLMFYNLYRHKVWRTYILCSQARGVHYRKKGLKINFPQPSLLFIPKQAFYSFPSLKQGEVIWKHHWYPSNSYSLNMTLLSYSSLIHYITVP